jgi:hypothetical protein
MTCNASTELFADAAPVSQRPLTMPSMTRDASTELLADEHQGRGQGPAPRAMPNPARRIACRMGGVVLGCLAGGAFCLAVLWPVQPLAAALVGLVLVIIALPETGYRSPRYRDRDSSTSLQAPLPCRATTAV